MEIKEQQRLNEQRRRENREQMVQRNGEKKLRVREQEKKIKDYMQQVWSYRVEGSQMNYLDKLEREKQRLKEKARSISEMEKVEEMIMRKMQQTQARKRDAITMLDEAKRASTILKMSNSPSSRVIGNISPKPRLISKNLKEQTEK